MSISSREKRIQELGQALLLSAREEEKKKEASHRWETALLEWCMQNEELRNRSFRFIDVFPSLKSSAAVFQHIQEYFPRSEHRLPKTLRVGLALTQPSFLTKPVMARVTRELYLRMAGLFIGAANEAEALEKFRLYHAQGLRLSVDLLGEKTTHDAEADVYEGRYRDLILALGHERKGAGFQNISVKLSALDPCFSPLDKKGVLERAGRRLRRLLLLARENDVFVHIDMEDYEVRDLTLDVVESVLGSGEFKGGVCAGVVLQAYLRDAADAADRILSFSSKLKEPLTIRLVRGAYWDSEVMKARELHWPIPVFTSKPEADAMFESLMEKILRRAPSVKLAVASHNVRSLAAAWAMAEELKIPKDALEFQCLYGMGEPFIPGLKPSGYPLRFYMPIGDPVIGMAYLVRRLLENVSSQSFVRRGFHEAERSGELLKAPPPLSEPKREIPSAPAFEPLAGLAFHDEKIRERFNISLETVRRGLGTQIPVVIGGREITNRTRSEVFSPVDGKTRVLRFVQASAEDADEAVTQASRAAASWQQRSLKERAGMLLSAADLMVSHRYELAALTVWEAGKPWREADAEVIEAVDFLRFYAWQAQKLLGETVTEDLDQETNRLTFLARGVTAVIAPWNFPLAILTGMSAAALVSGNPVILKPAEQSVLCGWKIYQIYRAAGIPEDALHFLPGLGENAGAALVKHPDTAVIAFTGSREAGLSILQSANEKKRDQNRVKKCVIEMGGKNPAIVDVSADLDLAIPAVLQSAFGFAGQKCSALSRLIVIEEIYDEFLARLAGAAKSFAVDSPLFSSTVCGPVIDAQALQKIESYIETGKAEGRIVFEGLKPGQEGFYVPPIIFSDLPESSKLLREEIFGPVLCVIKAADFDHALSLANSCEYALTAAVYSRTPSHLEKARAVLQAGNLYLNRSQTGAIVGRQPFGGFKLSGGGTKAGGADYLKEFCLMKTVSENISRHGFAPVREESSGRD